MNEYGYLQASTITERDEINVDGKNNQSALPAHMFEMTDELKQLILDRHNEARDEVEPPASPSLRHLTWNDNIAETAENYAKECYFGHKNRYYIPSLMFPGAGENIYRDLTSESEEDFVNNAMDSFINEKYNFFYPSTCYDRKMCDDYTRIIWDAVKEVGCAMGTCDSFTDKYSMSRGDFYNGGKYMVCQYYPAGNVFDTNRTTGKSILKPPYKTELPIV